MGFWFWVFFPGGFCWFLVLISLGFLCFVLLCVVWGFLFALGVFFVFDQTRGNFPSFQSDTGQGWKVYKCGGYLGLNLTSAWYITGL